MIDEAIEQAARNLCDIVYKKRKQTTTKNNKVMKTQDININLIGKKVRGIFTGMEITGTIIDIVSLWSSKMSGTETYGEDVPADPEMHLCSKGVVIALDTPVRWGDYFYTKYESTARICDDWGNLSHTELI